MCVGGRGKSGEGRQQLGWGIKERGVAVGRGETGGSNGIWGRVEEDKRMGQSRGLRRRGRQHEVGRAEATRWKMRSKGTRAGEGKRRRREGSEGRGNCRDGNGGNDDNVVGVAVGAEIGVAAVETTMRWLTMSTTMVMTMGTLNVDSTMLTVMTIIVIIWCCCEY